MNRSIELPNILFHINQSSELPSTPECPVKDLEDLLPRETLHRPENHHDKRNVSRWSPRNYQVNLPDKVWYIIANNISDVETFRSLALVSKSTFNVCLIQYNEIMSKYDRIAIYDGTYTGNPMFYLTYSDIGTIYNNSCDNPKPYILDYYGLITPKELTTRTSWIHNGFSHIIQPIM